MSALFKLQKELRNGLEKGESLEYGSDNFKSVEKFLRRHPGRTFGEFKRIYADYGNPYDSGNMKTNGLCWWVEHTLSKVLYYEYYE